MASRSGSDATAVWPSDSTSSVPPLMAGGAAGCVEVLPSCGATSGGLVTPGEVTTRPPPPPRPSAHIADPPSPMMPGPPPMGPPPDVPPAPAMMPGVPPAPFAWPLASRWDPAHASGAIAHSAGIHNRREAIGVMCSFLRSARSRTTRTDKRAFGQPSRIVARAGQTCSSDLRRGVIDVADLLETFRHGLCVFAGRVDLFRAGLRERSDQLAGCRRRDLLSGGL